MKNTTEANSRETHEQWREESTREIVRSIFTTVLIAASKDRGKFLQIAEEEAEKLILESSPGIGIVWTIRYLMADLAMQMETAAAAVAVATNQL